MEHYDGNDRQCAKAVDIRAIGWMMKQVPRKRSRGSLCWLGLPGR
jgi:hypothetical protein